MKNPHLRGKIILSTLIFLLVMGALSSTVYSHFQEYLSVSYWNTTAVPLKLTEGKKLVDDLSRTSPTWRQKLSEHILNQIDQELQSLEKQNRLRKNGEAKRLISKVQASLKKMKSGKQKFVSTGREPSLAPFYRGRHTLEYSLWELKGLTQDLNPGSSQSQKVYRVYALVNKWLVYVAHREINARRKGIPDSSPLTEAQVSPDPQAEETNTSFPQISEVAKITEQDMAKADKALSRQPAPLQETLPESNPEPIKSVEAETALAPEPPLTQEESPVSPQILDSEKMALSQSSSTEQAATPGIDLDAEENENSFSSQPPLNGPESALEAELETLANENPALPQPLTTEPATGTAIAAKTFESPEPDTREDSEPKGTVNEEASATQLIQEDTGSLEAIALAYWQYILGALVILIATFLLFRKKQKPFGTPVPNLSASEYQQEYTDQFSTRQTDESIPSEMAQSVDTLNDTPVALHDENFDDSRFTSQETISLAPETKSLFTDDEKKDWFAPSEDSETEALPTDDSAVNDVLDYSTPEENESSTYEESRESEESTIDSEDLEDEPTPAEDSIIENEPWSYKPASLQNENDEDQEDTTSQLADDKEDVPQDAANNSREEFSEDNEPKDYVTRRIEAWAMESKTEEPDTGEEMPADHVTSTTENEDSEDLISQQDESPTYEEIRDGMVSETETIDSNDKVSEDTISHAEESPSYEDLRAGMTAQSENVDSNAEDFDNLDFQEDESPSYDELRAGMAFQTQDTEAEENPGITDSHEVDSLVDHEALSDRGPDDEMSPAHETQETTAETLLNENAESAEAQETPVPNTADTNGEDILDRSTTEQVNEDISAYSESMEPRAEDPVEEESFHSSEEETKESFAETGLFAYKTFRITEDLNDDDTEETLADFTEVSETEIESEDSDAIVFSDDEAKDETQESTAELTEDFTEDEAEEGLPENTVSNLVREPADDEFSEIVTSEDWENTAPQFTDDATENNAERILTESSEDSSPENEMEDSASHSPSEDEILDRIASEEMGWTGESEDSLDSRVMSEEAPVSEAYFSEEQSADEEENRNLSFQTEDDASPDFHAPDSIASKEEEGPYDLKSGSDLEEEMISSEEPSLTGKEDLLEDASENTDPPLSGNNPTTPLSAWPENQQADSPEDVSLETILQILRGFADINKRLHKIAETRYAKKSSGDEKDTQKD